MAAPRYRCDSTGKFCDSCCSAASGVVAGLVVTVVLEGALGVGWAVLPVAASPRPALVLPTRLEPKRKLVANVFSKSRGIAWELFRGSN